MSIAREVMRTDLITIPIDSTVRHVMKVLMDRQISGAPVVNAQGDLVGIISELQLLQAIYTPEVKEDPIENFVTRQVLTVTEDTLISDVTNILVLHRIRRVPVVRDGRLVGIISRRDLLRFAANADEQKPAGSCNEPETCVAS